MKLSFRPLRSVSVLLIMIAGLFAIMLYIGRSTFNELERQRQDPSDSTQWALYQTSLELHKLHEAFERYREQANAESLENFNKRFDIFYSRVGLLQSGKARDPYRGDELFISGKQALTDFVAHLARRIDQKEFDALRSDAAIPKAFDDVEGKVAVFVTSAVQAQAVRSAEARSDLKRLLLLQLITSGLVIAACTFFAIVVLQQRNSALKREIALREGRDLLRATVKSSLDGVLIADAQGAVVDLNDAAANMFGFTAEEMIRQEMSAMIMPERYRQAHKAGMARYAATGKPKVMGRRIEMEAMRRDGTEFPVELSISSTGSGGKDLYVAFIRDITERRATEENLRSARDRAEAANRAKAQFLAAISHEMRTPLTGTLGALDLLAEGEMTEQQQKFIRTANRSGHALLAVINDVLDMSRLEEGKVDLDIEPLDLQEIITDVVEIVGKLAEERGNKINIRVDERMPDSLMGDTARIRQVLLNFATNAVKFTYDGSVDISVAQMARDDTKVQLEISVRDTGPGISESDQEKLFRNFSQLNTASSSVMGGSGLGLAISKRLVELMGGTIGVETSPGKGSRFWFQLSLETTAETVMEDATHPAPPPPDTWSAPKRILVIDDNETVRSIVSSQLAARGHAAETAESGLKGLAMLKSQTFDAVILDLSMPIMDGFEALRIIKAMPGAPGRTPVIALTAHALVEVRERCLAAGFDHFLTKPVKADELSRVIGEATTSGIQLEQASEQEPSEALPPVFDLAHLRDQFVSVSTADLRRIIDRYGTELEQQLSLLANEATRTSPQQLRRIAHVLAGSSSMVGALRLGALARHLDTLAIQNEDAAVLASVGKFVAVIRETQGAVEATKRELDASTA